MVMTYRPATPYLWTQYDDWDDKSSFRHWLVVPMGDWCAAYLVFPRGRGARQESVIAEVRIMPAPEWPAPPHHGLYMTGPFERAMPRGTTPEPFSFSLVHRGLTQRHFADALASTLATARGVWSDRDMRALRMPAPRRQRPVTARRTGRPPKPDTFYAAFARQYHAIEHHHRREPQSSTRDRLAHLHRVPVTTIAKWILVARQKGFLTTVKRGQRGGMVTRAALALLGGDQ
jgi:hypothetical protein